MRRFYKISLFLILVTALVATGCSSTKKGCGCPNKKGMVGY